MGDMITKDADSALLEEYRKIVPNAPWNKPINIEDMRRWSTDFMGYSSRNPTTVSEYTGV